MNDGGVPSALIQGSKVPTPTKAELAGDVALALGLQVPAVSSGSSVYSEFLDRIHSALTGDTSTESDAYRKTERVLHDLGLTYDPWWDTSEYSDTGGSTVTNRAYSRIRSAVTGTPRCFLVNVTDAEAGAKWETDHRTVYRYDSTVSGRGPLNDAGPGSLLIFYSTSKARVHPKHFIAHAEVLYIGPGWAGPWEATIGNYTAFARPVPASELVLDGWNHQNSITEITHETYLAIIAAADSEPLDVVPEEDPGGDVVAQRVLHEIPIPANISPLAVPDDLPGGALSGPEPAAPEYVESAESPALTSGDLPPAPTDRAKSKLAETRAVEIARLALVGDGWALERDCQKDKAGYDLHFRKGERELHVEVKGIISSALAFNLTPKEAWRVKTDPDFVVVAVTNVLSPTAYQVNLLTRDQLVAAKWVITGYRLKF